METLDRYDADQLDDRRYEDMDLDTRRLVEEELNRRDAREGRIAQVFQEDQEMERDDAHRRRFRRGGDDFDLGMNEQQLEEEEIINLEHFDVPLREWIATERPRNEIKRRFVSTSCSFVLYELLPVVMLMNVAAAIVVCRKISSTRSPTVTTGSCTTRRSSRWRSAMNSRSRSRLAM